MMSNIKNNIKHMAVVAITVALASQLDVDVLVTGFKISSAIIFFPIFLYIYRELNPVYTGLLAGIIVYISRILIYMLGGGVYIDVIWIYFPEIVFYLSYGILFLILNKRNLSFDVNKLLINIIICDFSSNLIEIYTRVRSDFFDGYLDILSVLLFAALIRSSIAWIVLRVLKYYRMLLIKEEHEERYKKLLWLTSRLKTEMYWMEKSMDHIEKVMTNAYELFENITFDRERNSWADRAVTIAKDVHEIKKEYGLVIRGVQEITENRLQDQGMYFKDIINILDESLKNEVRHKGHNIELTFQTGENFYTGKHYQLMSILRNIIMNAVDAVIMSKGDSRIWLIHETDERNHIFLINDTGCGIKDEDLDYIFSPGFSTKIDYKTGYINRGLGLSIVKDIVEEILYGHIKVYSTVGKGTTFEIFIPKESLEVDEQ